MGDSRMASVYIHTNDRYDLSDKCVTPCEVSPTPGVQQIHTEGEAILMATDRSTSMNSRLTAR